MRRGTLVLVTVLPVLAACSGGSGGPSDDQVIDAALDAAVAEGEYPRDAFEVVAGPVNNGECWAVVLSNPGGGIDELTYFLAGEDLVSDDIVTGDVADGLAAAPPCFAR